MLDCVIASGRPAPSGRLTSRLADELADGRPAAADPAPVVRRDLLGSLAGVTDGRPGQGRDHPVAAVLALAAAAVVAGSRSLPDAIQPRLFPRRSPQRSSANAARGGLEPLPAERLWRASNLHLPYSTALSEAPSLHLPRSCSQQDPQILAGLPRPVPLDRSRPGALPGILPLVQQRALPRRARPAHRRRRLLRPGRSRPGRARPDPDRRLPRPPRTLRPQAASPAETARHILDQPAPGQGHRHSVRPA